MLLLFSLSFRIMIIICYLIGTRFPLFLVFVSVFLVIGGQSVTHESVGNDAPRMNPPRGPGLLKC